MFSGIFLFTLAMTASGAETPPTEPSPTASVKAVRISFLPPPLEGTISLGIYNSAAKLVRILHREADVEDFDVGSDALTTTWDGKDDAGAALPAGKYHAKGYAVGAVEVEGIGFFFNDWVINEQSPHIRRISRIGFQNRRLIVAADIADAESSNLECDEHGRVTGPYHESLPTDKLIGLDAQPAVDPVAWHLGRDNTIWIIDRLRAGSPETEVKQFSTNQLARRLAIAPEDPQPIGIAASPDDDRIFLLEENAAMQRVRALTLVASKLTTSDENVSDWKVIFEKKILQHKDFTIQEGKPIVAGGKAPAEKITVRLQSNPLKNDAREQVDLTVGFDAGGTYVKTIDGLPLQEISDTSHITRVVLSPIGENSFDLFQDDTAVVEQFRVSRLNQMMAFDCGEIELK